MSNVENQIQQRVEAFVAELSELVREAALEAVSGALGGNGAPRARGGRRASAGRRKGEKRTAQAMEQMKVALLAQIKKTPGSGIEAIGKSLGIATRDLALPIRKLIAKKAIRRRGRKRATKYFPA